MAKRPLERFRGFCLELPEAYEEQTWGQATFRVRKKIFAMTMSGEGGITVCMKAHREDQLAMLAQGEPFLSPPYLGPKGWIGIDLVAKQLDWVEVSELVRESYRLVAPKGLSALIN
jgi:predicted DNA-binding protein (MmcQ/YjbR family)